MKPGFKQHVAILKPQGFLDGSNTGIIFNIQDICYMKALPMNALFISLKGVISFNSNAISFLATVLADIGREKKVAVGFCDYDKRKFSLLKRFLDDDNPISLIEDERFCYILFGSENPSGDILLWNDNAGQKGVLLITLHQRGYNVILATNYKDFLDRKEKFTYSMENSYLGGTSTKIVSYIRGNVIIYSLSGFMDAALSDNFDYMYHQNLLQTGFRLFIFESTSVSGLNVHAVNFICRLSVSMAEYNAALVFTGLGEEKLTDVLQEKMEMAGIMFFDSLEKALKDSEVAGMANNVEELHLKNKRTLTRDTIAKLPTFIDATIMTIETMTGVSALKQHVALEHWSIADKEGDYLGSSLGFYGDIDGMIALVFPRSIARKACHLLLGDDITDAEVVDSLSEFVNIIAGKTKANLSALNIKINITLPRTFEGLNDLESLLKGKKGAKVDFLMDERPFSFFLTR